MILQITNTLDKDQVVQLHTRVVKTVIANSAIRVDTGSDGRLINYYTSLVNYGFDVTILEADGQEENSFYDSLERVKEMSKEFERRKALQDGKVYSSNNSPKDSSSAKPSAAPVTLDDIPKKKPMEVGRTTNVGEGSVPRTLIDSKLGTAVDDYTPKIPDDYPEIDDPIMDRIEAEENKAKLEKESSDRKWYKLDELDIDQLKDLLLSKYEEDTKLRSKSRIIYHIMELADDSGDDVFELVDEYKEEKGIE